MATVADPIEQVKARIEQLSPAEARAELERGEAVLLDTRERAEWDEAHLDGATLVPPAEVTERIDELAPDASRRVILYCAAGNRSARAADALQSELGYENVASIAGGIKAWEAAACRSSPPRGSLPSSGCATRATPRCPRSASRGRRSCWARGSS